jgi:DNA-binding CsgD family transcriptional regulator
MAQTLLRGRSAALSQALDALRRAARTGHGALLVVNGEPGIGKSAVLRAVVEQGARSGFVVGSGKAEHGDQIAPGAPLLVALRSGPHPLLPADAFASLAPLYDKPLWLVDRIGALLEELANHGPVLVAIDDVQWADRLTRFALRVLPARLSGSPVVWAMTSRWAPSAALDEVIAGADDSTTITRITLGPLGAADIDDIAADRLGAQPSAQTRSLLAGVGGNPFWAVQVIEGLARRRERGQPVGDLHAELSVGVRERMAALSDEAAALIRLTSVWGRALSASDAGALLGNVSDAQVRTLAREGADNGLLRSVEHEVAFPHDLVHEAVYADIAPAERRALHRMCARYVVGYGGSALAAAAHFRASAVRDDEEAVLALEEAARECMTAMPDQAAELAQQAFALVSQAHPLWFTAGIRTVETLVEAQRDTAAVAVADRLLASAHDPDLIAQVELHACRALWCIGDCEQMESRAAAGAARAGVSAVSRARLGSAAALAATRTKSPTVAAAMAHDALAEGRRLDDVRSQRMAVVALIENARNEGRHRLALDRFTDLRRLSDSAYQAEEIRTLQHLDRYDEAEALLGKFRDDQDDVDRLLPSMLYAQMWQDHNLARLDAAEAGANTLLTLAAETGNHRYGLSASMVLAAVAVHRGERERVTQLLASIEAGELSHGGNVPRLRLLQGWLKASVGDLAASVAILEPLLHAAEEFRDPWPWSPPWMRTLARIGLDAGSQALARRAVEFAELLAQRNPGVATLDGTALHSRGLIAGDSELLAKAVRVLRNSPRPLPLADALKDLGVGLLADGRAEAGAEALLEASALYERVGATTGVRAVANLLRSQGLRGVRIPQAAARPQNGWAALTPTELHVVELISEGHSNRSAAAELRVSPNTVNTHLRAVFKKLDVQSRVQLTIAFRERSPQGG